MKKKRAEGFKKKLHSFWEVWDKRKMKQEVVTAMKLAGNFWFHF